MGVGELVTVPDDFLNRLLVCRIVGLGSADVRRRRTPVRTSGYKSPFASKNSSSARWNSLGRSMCRKWPTSFQTR